MNSNINYPKTSLDLVSNSEPDSFYFRKLESQGIYLNECQIEAVRNNDKALLATCSAGSGKSLSIIAKAGYLIAVEGIDPKSILAITFTRKTAEELKTRLKKIAYSNNVQASTIHGLCYKVLSQTKYKGWKLISTDSQRMSILKWLMKSNNLLLYSDPEDVLTSYSYMKNSLRVLNKDEYVLSLKLFDLFEEYKMSKKIYDFDDLLTTMLHALQTEPFFAESIKKQFKYILFDEIQDSSPVILSIVKILSQNCPIHAYGDLRQSIYSFRGSDIQLVEEFPLYFGHAKQISFNYNYRSSSDIVKLANAVICLHKGIFEPMISVKGYNVKPTIREFDDSLKEAQYIVSEIVKSVEQNESMYSDYAILYRTGFAASSLIDELSIRSIPFKIIGTTKLIYDEPLCKFIIAHIRLSLDKNDKCALSQILPSLYILKKSLIAYLEDDKNPRLESILKTLTLDDFQRKLIAERINIIESISLMPPHKAVETLLSDESIRRYANIDEDTADAEEAIYILEQLKLSADRFVLNEDFINFIDDLKNKTSHSMEKNQNAIILSTIHGSKGLEFNRVYIIGAVEGIIPHRYTMEPITKLSENNLPSAPADIDEECRLMYVAITRAKEKLSITYPKHICNKEVQISRFIKPFIKK